MLLLYTFGIIVGINLCYYLVFARFSFFKISQKSVSNSLPVSLIVCAKNEAENLSKNIPIWLQQKHPNYELVLINDASTDNTGDIINEFAKTNKKVIAVQVKNNEAFWGSKKYALTLGIKKATNQHLVFTDADCTPSSKNWLHEMSWQLNKKNNLVLGYGAYQKRKGILNKIIRYETAITAIQYFSYALSGIPYMGVGRNMAYTKSLFFNNNGFLSHMHIHSGDDDLFVNEVANKENTTICIHPQSFTYSIPKKTFKEWWVQKRRHLTTANQYKLKHKILLGIYYLSTLLFWIGAISIPILVSWKIPLLLIISRCAIQYLVLTIAFKKLKETAISFWAPLLELFLVLFQLIIFISNSISKPRRWK